MPTLTTSQKNTIAKYCTGASTGLIVETLAVGLSRLSGMPEGWVKFVGVSSTAAGAAAGMVIADYVQNLSREYEAYQQKKND